MKHSFIITCFSVCVPLLGSTVAWAQEAGEAQGYYAGQAAQPPEPVQPPTAAPGELPPAPPPQPPAPPVQTAVQQAPQAQAPAAQAQTAAVKPVARVLFVAGAAPAGGLVAAALGPEGVRAQLDPAGGGLGDAREDLQQRGFAGAVAADDADDIALVNRKVHVAQCPEVVEGHVPGVQYPHCRPWVSQNASWITLSSPGAGARPSMVVIS